MNNILSARTIGDLGDGHAADKIDQALQAAIRDADLRGADEKPRKVIITIDFLKVEDSSISIGLEVECKVPKYGVQRTPGDLRWQANKQVLEFEHEDSQSEEAA